MRHGLARTPLARADCAATEFTCDFDAAGDMRTYIEQTALTRKERSAGGPGVAGIPVNESTSGFVFFAHAHAGIEFEVGSHILVGARYRYTWVESADWIFDDASFHSASFTFRVPY